MVDITTMMGDLTETAAGRIGTIGIIETGLIETIRDTATIIDTIEMMTLTIARGVDPAIVPDIITGVDITTRCWTMKVAFLRLSCLITGEAATTTPGTLNLGPPL